MEYLNKLLEYNLVENNVYYKEYCDLINKNINTKKEKFKTQAHHILPKSYYINNNIKVDNSKDNIINIEYKYHVYAHYLLWKCAIPDWFKAANATMVLLAIKNKRFNNNDGELLALLPELQEAYEYAINCSANNQARLAAMKLPEFGKHLGECRKKYCDEHPEFRNFLKENAAKNSTGRHHYNNGSINVFTYDCPEGFVPGRLLTDEQRKSFGRGKDKVDHNTTGGTIVIHNDVCDKHIKPDELDSYLNNGWELGRGKERKIPRYRCTDGVNCMRVDDLNDIPEGWWQGGPSVNNIRCSVSLLGNCYEFNSRTDLFNYLYEISDKKQKSAGYLWQFICRRLSSNKELYILIDGEKVPIEINLTL